MLAFYLYLWNIIFMSKKPLYILKLGGSVVTYKHQKGASVRIPLLRKIAKELKNILKKKSFQLIIIHGAGAAGHQLAKKYDLQSGAGKDEKKWFGSLTSRTANQKLNLTIAEIFIKENLRAVSVHTASVIIQKDKKIRDCYLENVQEALRQNCIPILYGEMVFDKTLGMSICSGDSILPHLAEKLRAQEVFFASDIDGIFTQDPFIHKDAKLIKKISFAEIKKKTKLSGSHNVDVTGGLSGKIERIKGIKKSEIKHIKIFNGLKIENYQNIFFNKNFPHSTIIL